ncbi:MAG TPA: hypothetical protein VL970_02440, partial [Candidatus Acidoferrales bacterium]|nr:hypothetical protein [Candidatus Acidoferrales bacterium]
MKREAKFFRVCVATLTFFILISVSPICVCRADVFGDISALADVMYTGNSYHGYAATAVTLE